MFLKTEHKSNTRKRSGTWFGLIEELSRIERDVYELILQAGELMAKYIPLKKAGVIAGLICKELIEVYRRRVSPSSEKRHKYLRVRDE